MARLSTSSPLPTVVLRHKISGVKRIMNAAEYALKIGGISQLWRLVEYRGVNTPDSIVERALKESEIEWQKTRDGRDDRPERRFEDRAIGNIIIPDLDLSSTPDPAPSEEAATAPSSAAQTSPEANPAPATPAVKEPLLGPADGVVAPPKRGRGRPRKNPL